MVWAMTSENAQQKEDAASAYFYIRIAQILFAGLFTTVLLGAADRIIHSRARKQEIAFSEGA